MAEGDQFLAESAKSDQGDQFLAESAKSDRDTLKFAACIGLELTGHEEAWLTDEVLSIYCRARESQEERIELMRGALQWRTENREAIVSKTCPTCDADPLSHDARLFGADVDGDPVMMNCFQLPRDLTPEHLTRHMICLFERTLQEFPPKQNDALDPQDGHLRIRKWTWVIDLYGFGVRHMSPKTTYQLITLLQTAYRGRLKRCLLLDSPMGFETFYENVAKPFMKPATTALIDFVSYADASTRFRELFGDSLADELVREAAENREDEWEKKTWTTFYGGPQELKLPGLS